MPKTANISKDSRPRQSVTFQFDESSEGGSRVDLFQSQLDPNRQLEQIRDIIFEEMIANNQWWNYANLHNLVMKRIGLKGW